MSTISQKSMNFLEYFGFRSKSYHHSEALANYDENDPLGYYLDHSPRAHFEGELDPDGLPIYNHKGKKLTLPVISMLYALGNIEEYRKTKNELYKQNFLKIAHWLVKSQDENGGWKSGNTMSKFGLNQSFYSAMIQGMAISTLVRAALVTGQNSFIDHAAEALRLFEIDVKEGGVSREIDGYVFYEEYPSAKKYHVLNGFFYAIWGLLDLVRYNNDATARQLWEEGLKTIVNWLPKYDMGYWSLYHIGDGMTNPATIPYHKLQIEQLKTMYDITGQKIFKEHADKWNGYLNNRFKALRTLPQKICWNLFRGL
jgi:hypothetical protein